MEQNIVATDFDGVLCKKFKMPGIKKWKNMNAHERKIYRTEYFKIISKIEPEQYMIDFFKDKQFVIITARKSFTQSITLSWLKANGLNPLSVFYMRYSNTRENMIQHKAEIIKSMGYTVYYEDDKKICRALKRVFGDKLKIHCIDNGKEVGFGVTRGKHEQE
jgi:hypothetical protein